jgi:hypothetical protein
VGAFTCRHCGTARGRVRLRGPNDLPPAPAPVLPAAAAVVALDGGLVAAAAAAEAAVAAAAAVSAPPEDETVRGGRDWGVES